MNLERFRAHLMWAENRLEYLYDDKTGEPIVLPSGGKITGGVGWNFTDRGIPSSVVDSLLEISITDALSEARGLPYWNELNDARQLVVSDMVFNLGTVRFLKFVKLNAALSDGDYEAAAEEMVASAWYRQVGRRAVRLVTAMRSGLWHEQT